MKMITLSMFYALCITTTNAGERISEVISKDTGPDYTRYSSLLRVPGTATTPERRIYASAMFDRSRGYSSSSHTEEGDLLGARSYPIVGGQAENKFHELEARYNAQPQKAEAAAREMEPDHGLEAQHNTQQPQPSQPPRRRRLNLYF